MKLRQLMYGVGGAGASDAGYQTLAASPGISKKERNDIEDICTTGDPVLEEDAFACGWAFKETGEKGRYGLARIVPAGRDRTGRPGIVFAHALVLSEELLSAARYNPFCIVRWVENRLAGRPPEGRELPLLEITPKRDDSTTPLGPLIDGFPGEALDALFSALFGGARIGLTSDTYDELRVASVIEALMACLPVALKRKFDFSSFHLRPGSSAFHCVYFPRRVQKRAAELSVFVLGEGPGRGTPPPSDSGARFAGLLRQEGAATLAAFLEMAEEFEFCGDFKDLPHLLDYGRALQDARARATAEAWLDATDMVLRIPAGKSGETRRRETALDHLHEAGSAFRARPDAVPPGGLVKRFFEGGTRTGSTRKIADLLLDVLEELLKEGRHRSAEEFLRAVPGEVRTPFEKIYFLSQSKRLFEGLSSAEADSDEAREKWDRLWRLYGEFGRELDPKEAYRGAAALLNLRKKSGEAPTLLAAMDRALGQMPPDPSKSTTVLQAWKFLGRSEEAMNTMKNRLRNGLRLGEAEAVSQGLSWVFRSDFWTGEESESLIRWLEQVAAKLEPGPTRDSVTERLEREREQADARARREEEWARRLVFLLWGVLLLGVAVLVPLILHLVHASFMILNSGR